jgi:hypothetical protein
MAISERSHVGASGELRGRIDGALRGGATLSQVDAQVIRPRGLDDESEAAMWMYARASEQGQRAYAARQAATARAARDTRVLGTD